MSTRCNVIIKDQDSELIFYRHSDGYPSCIIPSLEKLMGWLKSDLIRDNVSQFSGWLIRLGASEYEAPSEPSGGFAGWKVGAYEPTTAIHGDIAYLYVIDLVDKKIYIDGQDYEYSGVFKECSK